MASSLHTPTEELRAKSSAEAADWLLANHPFQSTDWGRAIQLIGARSWLRDDQVRLAKHYLAGVSYANGHVYDTFLSFMKVSVFLRVLRDCMSTHDGDVLLLRYHLPRKLRAACKSDSDRDLAEAFLAELGAA